MVAASRNRNCCLSARGALLLSYRGATIIEAGRIGYRLTPTLCRCFVGVAFGKGASVRAAASMMVDGADSRNRTELSKAWKAPD